MNKDKPIPFALVKFNADLKDSEVPQFRGAINSLLKEEDLALFHNHLGDSAYQYAYPLIQYKCIEGKAAILYLNEAVCLIGKPMVLGKPDIWVGKVKKELYPATLLCDSFCIERQEEPVTYVMKSWIPFNSENYDRYVSLTSMRDKVDLLNSILTGNIMSCLKGLGIYVDFQVDVEIQDLDKHSCQLKEVGFISFDVVFISNINLPKWIGLGKATSKGFGNIIKIK